LAKGKIEYPGSVKLIAMDAAAKRLVLLAEGPRDQEEKKKAPKGLKGLDKKLFKQQHDGRISTLAEYDLGSGEMTRRQDVFFYPTSQEGMLLEGRTTLILTYGNDNAIWEGETISLFETENSYNYGAGISPDRKIFATGGLLKGTYVRTEGRKMTTFSVPSLPGWPEYFKGFGFGPDGTAYGVTTGYRLVVIDPQGQVVKAGRWSRRCRSTDHRPWPRSGFKTSPRARTLARIFHESIYYGGHLLVTTLEFGILALEISLSSMPPGQNTE
jgi:hypothetical protein